MYLAKNVALSQFEVESCEAAGAMLAGPAVHADPGLGPARQHRVAAVLGQQQAEGEVLPEHLSSVFSGISRHYSQISRYLPTLNMAYL